MRIFFVGSTQLGHACLRILNYQPNIEICGVLTAPSLFKISYAPEGVKNILHCDFAPLAKEIGCPLVNLDSKMTSAELFNEIESLKPDLVLVIGWHHMIPKSWLTRWPMFGVHASLLPRYAGGAPLVWAIIEGQKKVGVTLFQLDDGIDSGPIVNQYAIRVRRSDDIASILARVEVHTMQLIKEEVPRLLSADSQRVPQNLAGRTIYPQRNPTDGQIDAPMSIRKIRNFVRAQTHPYPGAFLEKDGVRTKIWKLGRSKFTLKRKTGLYRHGKVLYLGLGRRSLEIVRYSHTSLLTMKESE